MGDSSEETEEIPVGDEVRVPDIDVGGGQDDDDVVGTEAGAPGEGQVVEADYVRSVRGLWL